MKLDKINFHILFISIFIVIFISSCDNSKEQDLDLKYNSTEHPIIADYSTLSWTKAFEKMHKTFSKEYAFTDWKKIDWESKRKKYLPQIEEAEKNNDINSYIVALREYTISVPDGHVFIEGDFSYFMKHYNGGTFGLFIAKLDDGRYIAFYIDKDGAAAKSGIKPGAEILKWDGLPIEEAVKKTSTLWRFDDTGTSKTSLKLLLKYILLARGPVNEKKSITYKNPGDTNKKTFVLSSQKVDMKNNKFYPFIKPNIINDETKELTYKILPSGVGYIKINILIPLKAFGRKKEFNKEQYQKLLQEAFYSKMEDAINLFNKHNVPGVIIDVRGNGGGDEYLTAKLCGYFYNKASFYEYETYYKPETGNFPICNEIWIKPQHVKYTGNVIALVNLVTYSAAEGIPMAVKKLKKGNVVGFYGTNGAEGMTGGIIRMPDNFTINFPVGQSLNINKDIQIESRNGKGGVNPTLRVPLTLENVLKVGKGEDVELKYAESFILNKSN